MKEERLSWITDVRTNDGAGALGGNLRLYEPGCRGANSGAKQREGTGGSVWDTFRRLREKAEITDGKPILLR